MANKKTAVAITAAILLNNQNLTYEIFSPVDDYSKRVPN